MEFGDEFIIESYKIPWLIWIQLLIMILLIVILFFGFAVFGTDLSVTSIAASPSTLRNAAAPTHLETSTSSSNIIIKAEDQRARRDVGTSGATISDCLETSGVTISEENDHQSGEESSLEETMLFSIFQSPNHPCNYIGLAKRALFKCFGLDSSSESSGNCIHEKRD